MPRFLSTTLPAALFLASACTSSEAETRDSSSAAAPAPASASATPGAGSAAAPAMPAETDARVSRADQARIRGNPAAPLWVVVVSDFQCPYCERWERETAPRLLEEFVETGKVRLAFLNYPLQQHPNAVPAAEAAMCAGAQGKFWEVHDRIFQTQAQWSGLGISAPFFERLAREAGVELEAYQQCISDHVMRPMIDADAERGARGGARSTPTFFIGGTVLAGAEPIEAFRSAIAKELAAVPK